MSTRTESSDSNRASLADESLVGCSVGKYEIIRVIGRGGMGMVYEAVNTAIGKRVAMKFVDAEMAKNKDAVARFQREAQAASAVESAHIVEIFDSGISEEGLPFIVMELLRGEDLGHRIKRCGRLELNEALHIIAQILRGLHRAHAAGIVHRDLKPDNIFLVDRDDDPNFAKVLDFGISKMHRPGDVPVHTLTRQGTVLGTPFYMSPEQAQALSDLDGRTDLWSVGAILYETLSGRPPYTGATYEQVIINICMKDAEDVRAHNPGVPEVVARVLQKALARERPDRFQTAREFLDALIAASGGLLSSRPGRTSGEDLSSGRTPVPAMAGGRVTPSVPASTPGNGSKARGDEFEPTLEVNQVSGDRPAVENPSRVGWTSGRVLAARRDRRRFALVAISALLVGAVVAFVAVKLRNKPDAPVASASPSPNENVDFALSSNAPKAKFWVNGQEVLGGILHVARGETKKVHVRVEADGFSAKELDVTLEPGKTPDTINLVASAEPVVSPVPTVSATAAPGADPKRNNNNGRNGKPPATAKIDTTAVPKPPETAKPPGTGVAPELKLKTD